MSKAPNETQEQYDRKTELQNAQRERELTLPELKELGALLAVAISHLTINRF